jgi:hypothetical protein
LWRSVGAGPSTASLLRRLQVLVQRLPAHLEVAGDLGFVVACADALQHSRYVFSSQGFLAFFVDAFALGNGDVFPLGFADDHTLEPGEGSEHLEQQN